jgi:hypothetical protein
MVSAVNTVVTYVSTTYVTDIMDSVHIDGFNGNSCQLSGILT